MSKKDFKFVLRNLLMTELVVLNRFTLFSNNLPIIMLSSNDYSKMTLEELVSEEKKMKSQKTTTALFIGFVIGIAVWSATHKGGLLTYILLIFAYQIGYRNAQNFKRIQEEISGRDTVR